jgi:hypothetical protein
MIAGEEHEAPIGVDGLIKPVNLIWMSLVRWKDTPIQISLACGEEDREGGGSAGVPSAVVLKENHSEATYRHEDPITVIAGPGDYDNSNDKWIRDMVITWVPWAGHIVPRSSHTL